MFDLPNRVRIPIPGCVSSKLLIKNIAILLVDSKILYIK
jgi:hypothetical protein